MSRTPGPWSVYMHTRVVSDVHHAGMHGMLQKQVADCGQYGEDDARLIAAAPELLEALKQIAEWQLPETGMTWPSGGPISYEAQYGSNGSRDYIRGIARAAIAKATEAAHV